MGHKLQKSTPLSIEDISVLEDSCHFLNRSVNALNLQMRRLEKYDFKSSDDFWEFLSDVHFYIVALKRLRQSTLVGTKIDKIETQIQKELSIFDDEISDAINMRHILEHVDEYIRNKGRNKNIENSNLYGIIPCEGGISWAGLEFNRYKTHEAASNLFNSYKQITSHEFKLYKEANEK